MTLFNIKMDYTMYNKFSTVLRPRRSFPYVNRYLQHHTFQVGNRKWRKYNSSLQSFSKNWLKALGKGSENGRCIICNEIVSL